MKSLGRVVFACFLLVVCHHSSVAQWTKVAPNLFGAEKEFGALAFENGTFWGGLNKLYKSTDYGLTWQQVTSFPNASEINDIEFFDAMNGLITTFPGLVYKTTNGGSSWKLIASGSYMGGAVYAGSPNNIVYQNTTATYVSSNGGSSWTQTPAGGGQCVFGYPNGEVFAMGTGHPISLGTIPEAALWRSTDRGWTWTQQAAGFGVDSWTFKGNHCNSDYICLVNENYYFPDNASPLSIVIVSTDGGNSFDTTFQTPTAQHTALTGLTGGVALWGNTVFTQTGDSGVFRSTDQGRTWKMIGGPVGPADSRLIACAGSNVVIAVDTGGSIWRTLMSGNAPVGDTTRDAFVASNTRPALVATGCASVDSTITLFGRVCDPYDLWSVQLIGSSNFTLTHVPVLPVTLETNIDIGIRYSPSTSNSDTATLLLHYVVNGRSYDTTIVVLGTRAPAKLAIAMAAPKLSAANTCTTVDTTIVFTNLACDPLTLNAISISDARFFSVDTSTLPVSVAAGGVIPISIVYAPANSTAPIDSTQLKLRFTIRGMQFDTTITITGRTAHTRDFSLSTPTVTISQTYACVPTESTITITNGCGALQLSSARLSDSSIFHIRSYTPSTQSYGLLSIDLYARSQSKGLYETNLLLSFVKDGHQYDTVIPLQYAVAQPARFAVTLSTDTVSFGSTSLCAPLQSTIRVANNNCDPMTITAMDWVDASSDFSLLSQPKLPLTVTDGTSDSIRIAFAPITSGPTTRHLHLRTTKDGQTIDTIITFSGIGQKSAPAALSTRTVFSVQSSPCDVTNRTVYLKNRSCDTLTYTTSLGTSSSFFSIVAPQIKLYPGDSVPISLRFGPGAPGNQLATAYIYVKYEPSGMRDTMQIALVSLVPDPIPASVSAQQVSLFSTAVCDSAKQTFYIVNHNCAPITFTPSIPGAKYFRVSPVAATTLAPGDSAKLVVLFGPNATTRETSQLRIAVQYEQPASKDTFIVALAGDVAGSIPAFIDHASLTFSNLRPCEMVDTQIIISNPDPCRSVVVSTASIILPYGSSVDLSQLARALKPGENAIVKLHFIPEPGADTIANIVMTIDGHDTTVVVRIQAQGNLRQPLSVSGSSGTFASPMCLTKVDTFYFSNPFCDPLTIDQLRLSNVSGMQGQFALVGQPALPLSIAGQDSLMVLVAFDANGVASGTLNVHASTGNMSRSVALAGNISQFAGVAPFALYADEDTTITTQAGKPFTVTFKSDSKIPGALDLRSISFTLNFNDNVLTPDITEIKGEHGWSATGNYQSGKLLVRASSLTSASLETGDAIVTIPFTASITDTNATRMTISKPALNEQDPKYDGCVLSATATGTTITVSPSCGSDLLTKTMNGESLIGSLLVHPNPMTLSDNASVDFSLEREAYVRITLSDELSRQVQEIANGVLSKGEYHLPILRSQAEPGIYFITFESNNRREIRQVIIE